MADPAGFDLPGDNRQLRQARSADDAENKLVGQVTKSQDGGPTVETRRS